MRYVWTDAGNDPRVDYPDVDGFFLAMFDSRTTKTQLNGLVQRGKARGIYSGAGWFNGMAPEQIVNVVVAEYQRVLVSGLRVQLNLEEHDPDRILAVLEGLRKAVPAMPLSWALEGMQGGWMSFDFVGRVVAAKVRVVPETFKDPMAHIELRDTDSKAFLRQLLQEMRPPDEVKQDLLDVGFPKTSISLFWDAAFCPPEADGFLFTQGRLP